MAASMSLNGKVALVTGGSKGIGRSIVLGLAKLGASIAINFSSDASAADALVEEIGSDRALAIKADAGNVQDIESMVAKTVEKFQKIDILIPNAGLLLMKDLAGTTEEDFDRLMAVNVKGPYFLAQKAAPHIPDGGRIILVSTSLCGANTVTPNYLLYVTSKGAIEQMVRLLSKDLARRKICVNAIAPGPTATDLFLKGKSEQIIKGIASANPQNRLGEPDEVASAFLYLAGEGGQWVSGQTLRVK
ncbi:hypothetical protein MMC25_006074 [Agyrium rufum]|nr:hypothetical protein [Agyrium rufum]